MDPTVSEPDATDVPTLAPVSFGVLIKRARIAKRLRQKDVAAALGGGYHQSFISRIETGESSPQKNTVSIEEIEKLAEVLGIPLISAMEAAHIPMLHKGKPDALVAADLSPEAITFARRYQGLSLRRRVALDEILAWATADEMRERGEATKHLRVAG